MNDVIYVYSAYYDDRPAAGFLPSVRVLLLSTIRRDETVYCSLWFAGFARPYVVRGLLNAEAGTGSVNKIIYNSSVKSDFKIEPASSIFILVSFNYVFYGLNVLLLILLMKC